MKVPLENGMSVGEPKNEEMKKMTPLVLARGIFAEWGVISEDRMVKSLQYLSLIRVLS